MSNTNTGGQAFPCLELTDGGMTLRDYFAAKAMQAIITGFSTSLPPTVMAAKAAYEYADAMLKARES